jgi:predicted Zn-dependent peptidase
VTGRRRTAALALAALAGCAAPGRALREEPDRSRPPPLGAPAPLRLPAQQHFRLSNGLRVRLVEYRRLPVVALNLVVDAGAVHDPADRPGMAAFTAAMLTEGTATRSATRISDELGFVGAHLSAGAGFDSAQLWGASLVRHVPLLLELLADVVRNPAFAPEDFARVQDRRVVALVQQRDQPGAMAARAFAPLRWGSHPYGHSAMGTEESLRATARQELARFHARYWRPGGAELVAVGHLSRAELEPLLERTLGGWRGEATEPPPAPGPQPPPARTVLLKKADAPQTYLLLGAPGLARSDPDYEAAEVAFQILGGGTSSRLFRRLREEKGYTYGMGARMEARRLGGTSVVGGSVKADRTGDALRELLGELAALRERDVSPEELRDAQDGIVRGLPADFATAGAIAARLADAAVHGLADDEVARFAAAVRRVTAADVRRVARQRLDPAHLTAVLVGDPALVPPQLAGLGLGPLEVR